MSNYVYVELDLPLEDPEESKKNLKPKENEVILLDLSPEADNTFNI